MARASKSKKGKYRRQTPPDRKPMYFALALAGIAIAMTVLFFSGRTPAGLREVEKITRGMDVARYQGTIDWAEAAENGVEFAMVRLGYRSMEGGEITEDSNARYNLQEAAKYGVKLGAYFFSTAVTPEEAREEAAWVAQMLAPYPITYPVAYNCEGFNDPENRHAHLSVTERTDIALEFLKAVERHGYEAMFYASKNEMEGDILWEVSRIEDDYKIWVAQYPENPYPETAQSSYSRPHQMWQYTREGKIPGVSAPVDLDVAYFGYEGIAQPKSPQPPAPATPDVEAMMDFREVWEHVTAKEETNLRDIPSQDAMATVLYTLQNGEIAMRTGVSDSGWSRLIYEGNTYYAVSSYLTTQLEPEPDDGIQTVFTAVSHRVTPKDAVNLRTIPSVTDPESKVVVKLLHGEVITRTGINEDVGWSRVEWKGQTLYCVTSYLEVVE